MCIIDEIEESQVRKEKYCHSPANVCPDKTLRNRESLELQIRSTWFYGLDPVDPSLTFMLIPKEYWSLGERM